MKFILFSGSSGRRLWPLSNDVRSWGEVRRISYSDNADGINSLTSHLLVKDGKSICCHCHTERSEVWTIVKGRGILALDGKVMEVKTGYSITIPPLRRHAIKAIDELELLEVQFGRNLDEKDIMYFDFVWE